MIWGRHQFIFRFILVISRLIIILSKHRSVSKALYEAGFRIKAVIPSASVPIGMSCRYSFVPRSSPWSCSLIVKCEDPKTGIKCDININEQLGLHNSMLIATYCQLNIYLRPLIVLIKQWAKSHGLNNPSGGPGLQATFSSYALSMMVIGYLQVWIYPSSIKLSLPPHFSTLNLKKLNVAHFFSSFTRQASYSRTSRKNTLYLTRKQW